MRKPRFNTYRTPHSGVISGPGMMDVPKPIIFAVRDRCLGAGMLVLLTLADIIVCAAIILVDCGEGDPAVTAVSPTLTGPSDTG